MKHNSESTDAHIKDELGSGTAFRKDIEGLRAIAILAVVACHAKIPYLQGGFVGVDIFFVLSGYLITGLLVKELDTTGKLNFLSFYAKRFKRLLPGLALMILVTCLASYYILAPAEQIPQAEAAASAILWLSNFKFIFANAGYFNSGTSNLFLHTWSLAVEEQFYLIWPALILFFVRSKTSLFNWLIYVFVLCLGLSITLSNTAPVWSFYSMPSRGWQFALGGIILLTNNHRQLTNFAGFCGLALIITSLLLIDEQMQYPGVAALIPSLGTALLLYSAGSPVNKLLSLGIMQAIGKVSYSWYLWHWPVLLLGLAVFNRHDMGFQLLLVFSSLMVAVAAYALVEKPIRRGNFQPKTVLAFSLTLMAVFAFPAQRWSANAHIWATTEPQLSLNRIKADRPGIYDFGCDQWYLSSEVVPCTSGSADASKVAVLIGDSIAAQWYSALALIYAHSDWRLVLLTKSACPMIDESIYYSQAGGIYAACDEWRNAAVQYLVELKPQVIFIGNSAIYGFEHDDLVTGTKRTLEPLVKVAGRVYMLRGTPRLPFEGVDCLARHEWQPEYIASLSDCSSVKTSNPDDDVLSALQEVSESFENVRILDFNDLVCPAGICKARIDGQVVFRDTAHITDSFVKSITRDVRSTIEKAN